VLPDRRRRPRSAGDLDEPVRRPVRTASASRRRS
jgi:hypothetical protein